nr:hypothetical protein [Streptomyces chartreusis]
MDAFGGVNGTKATTTRNTASGVTPAVDEKSETFTDAAGRTVRTTGRSLDGTTVNTAVRYDVFGRATSATRPYFTGSSPQWTFTSFDSLDRPTSTTFPDGTVDKLSYPGVFKTEHEDADHHKAYSVVDLQGRILTSATVPASGADVTTTFTHGPTGVLTAKDPQNTTSQSYDQLGRLTQAVDANTGTMTYKYNGFGEQYEQQQTTSHERQVTVIDDLGRPPASSTTPARWKRAAPPPSTTPPPTASANLPRRPAVTV